MTWRVVLVVAMVGCKSTPEPAPDALPIPQVLPDRLSDTALYSDIATKTIAGGVQEFAPANVLWSDAAVKTRWISVPAGASIDTRDMSHWVFPVGTRLFKEFALDGKRLETRVIWRVADTGDRETDTLFGAYVWDDAEADAVFVQDGAMNVRATAHDVPSADTCWRCHVGEPGHVLGVSAVQLAGDFGDLPLSDPPAEGTTFGAPDPVQGYLHANCGHCHNPNGGAWADSSMILQLASTERDPHTTQLVQTTVGVALEHWVGHGFTQRVVAGDPSTSALMFRIEQRTKSEQMPPIATELVDVAGAASVRTWISAQ